MTLARTLVRRWRALRPEPLPAAVMATAREHLLDAIGVGLASSGSAVGAPYLAYAETVATGGKASVFGCTAGASAADAAMINGGLIHSLEYDDTHTGSIVHGSAVLAAAALAAGEAAGATGAAVLGAYARGWEVLVRLGLAAPGGFQARGFQITSVGGALVAALIGAELFGLDEDQSLAAVGIALSQSSGVFEFLTNGSSVKSLHPGWAAHGGLIAAQLARAGLTGPLTAIEGKFGLFATFAGDPNGAGRLSVLLDDFGTLWHLPDAAFKFYPCCHYIHPFVEAAGILADRGVTPETVRRLTCRVPQGAAAIVCEPWELKQAPATPHAARWSLPIVIAARLFEGVVGLGTFEAPISPAVRELAARMAWEPLRDADFPRLFEAELCCELADGSTETVRVNDVYGNRSRPAAKADVRRKFRANAARVLDEAAVAALETAVAELDRAASLAAISDALRPEIRKQRTA
ncbi:MAG: MmgE/PrpD family protein [Rhodopila sp.]|nr:MmgE/PrpD family protein [Rhodopila sp.]